MCVRGNEETHKNEKADRINKRIWIPVCAHAHFHPGVALIQIWRVHSLQNWAWTRFWVVQIARGHLWRLSHLSVWIRANLVLLVWLSFVTLASEKPSVRITSAEKANKPLPSTSRIHWFFLHILLLCPRKSLEHTTVRQHYSSVLWLRLVAHIFYRRKKPWKDWNMLGSVWLIQNSIAFTL